MHIADDWSGCVQYIGNIYHGEWSQETVLVKYKTSPSIVQDRKNLHKGRFIINDCRGAGYSATVLFHV